MGMGAGWLAMTADARGEIQYGTLERTGIESIWSNTLEVSRDRAEVVGITIFVNHDPEQALESHEVRYNGDRRIRFAQFDIGPDGQAIGRAEARRLAEKEVLVRKAMGQQPELVTTSIPPVTLFSTTRQGVVQAIDGETGRGIWTASVGSPRRPTSVAGANEKLVGVVNGSTLYVLRRDTGEPKFERLLGAGPMMSPLSNWVGPSLSKDWVFVPTMSGRMEAYHLEEERAPWIYYAGGDITGSPTITSRHVVWTTTKGRLVACDGLIPEVRFRLQAESDFYGSAAYSAPARFFVTSISGYVFAVDANSDRLLWEISLGQPIHRAPVAFDDHVFVVTQDLNLISLSADKGVTRWTVPGVRWFLAASKMRIYVTDQFGRVLILHRETGEQIAPAFTVNSNDMPVVNTETDRIYVASRSGQVHAFRELGSQLPTIHHPPEVVAEPEPLQPRKRKTTPQPSVTSPSDKPVPEDDAEPEDDATPEAAEPAESDPFAAEDDGTEDTPAPADTTTEEDAAPETDETTETDRATDEDTAAGEDLGDMEDDPFNFEDPQ